MAIRFFFRKKKALAPMTPVAATATNSATGVEIPVRTLHDKAGNAVTKKSKFATGAVSLVQNAKADAPGLLVESLALSVVTATPHNGVQLWEGGPYWADTNIGADEPWEYGLYFWWGDTVGYRREGDALVASNGSSHNFSFDSNNTPTYGKSLSALESEGWIVSRDSTTVLAPKHDAAQVQWGGGWRMPTFQELTDLSYNKCDWTWTTMNGVNGYVVRGRGGYSEASIFLPATGYGDGSSLGYVGLGGSYWSSTPDKDSVFSLAFGCSLDRHGWGYSYRYTGFPVRPVQGFG